LATLSSLGGDVLDMAQAAIRAYPASKFALDLGKAGSPLRSAILPDRPN
jgi:hypothetical protein